MARESKPNADITLANIAVTNNPVDRARTSAMSVCLTPCRKSRGIVSFSFLQKVPKTVRKTIKTRDYILPSRIHELEKQKELQFHRMHVGFALSIHSHSFFVFHTEGMHTYPTCIFSGQRKDVVVQPWPTEALQQDNELRNEQSSNAQSLPYQKFREEDAPPPAKVMLEGSSPAPLHLFQPPPPGSSVPTTSPSKKREIEGRREKKKRRPSLTTPKQDIRPAKLNG